MLPKNISLWEKNLGYLCQRKGLRNYQSIFPFLQVIVSCQKKHILILKDCFRKMTTTNGLRCMISYLNNCGRWLMAWMDCMFLQPHTLLALSHVDSGRGYVTCFSNRALANLIEAEVQQTPSLSAFRTQQLYEVSLHGVN